MRGTFSGACLLLLAAAASSCEAVDRVRGRDDADSTLAATATAGNLMLALQLPGMLRAGEEGTIRLSLTNRGDSTPEGLRLDLIVPGWMELSPPQPGDREVIMAADSGEGTRFSYTMNEPPLGPGETQLIEQRIRVPLRSPAGTGAPGRLIRARLVTAEGQTLTEVQSEVTLDSAFAAESGAAAQQVTESRDRLGPARLGMSAVELRQAVPRARDTTWSQEGMTERGLVLPLGGGRALAVLNGDSVVRMEVRDGGLETREGLGVGSTFEELRSAYGRPCAGAGEGTVVVWFPAASGISFALDVPLSTVQQVQQNPEAIPGTARVTSWWLRSGTSDCPVAGG